MTNQAYRDKRFHVSSLFNLQKGSPITPHCIPTAAFVAIALQQQPLKAFGFRDQRLFGEHHVCIRQLLPTHELISSIKLSAELLFGKPRRIDQTMWILIEFIIPVIKVLIIFPMLFQKEKKQPNSNSLSFKSNFRQAVLFTWKSNNLSLISIKTPQTHLWHVYGGYFKSRIFAIFKFVIIYFILCCPAIGLYRQIVIFSTYTLAQLFHQLNINYYSNNPQMFTAVQATVV